MELKSVDAESEYKASVGDDGNVVLKKKSKIARGSKSRAGGSQFEIRVRKDLEEKNWIVDKWSNNLDLEIGKIHPCKRSMRFINKSMRFMALGTGFPDFVCYQKMENNLFKVIGVEVKMNGTLSRIEKEKCAWYLKNEIFNEILIASKIQEKRSAKIMIGYVNVSEILGRMRG